jgi:hypothetical protein
MMSAESWDLRTSEADDDFGMRSRKRPDFCVILRPGKLDSCSGWPVSPATLGRIEIASNSLTRGMLHQTTGLDTRFLAHEISTGKRRRGAFETDLTVWANNGVKQSEFKSGLNIRRKNTCEHEERIKTSPCYRSEPNSCGRCH